MKLYVCLITSNLGRFVQKISSQIDPINSEVCSEKSILPPMDQFDVKYYVPKSLSENIHINDTPLYLGARKLQEDINVAVELKFKVADAKW